MNEIRQGIKVYLGGRIEEVSNPKHTGALWIEQGSGPHPRRGPLLLETKLYCGWRERNARIV